MEKKILQRQIRIFAKAYKRIGNYSLENWRLSYLKRIFAGLNINRAGASNLEERLLDIGVGGTGYTVIEAAKRNILSVGIDLSWEGMKKAAQLAREVFKSKADKRYNFLVSSAQDLPFKDNTFSKIISVAVMEHLPDDKKAFDEITRVTRSQGKIFIMVPNAYPVPLLYKILNMINDRRMGHLRHYLAKEMIREFKKRGFELEDLIYHAHSIKILQWILSIIIPPFRRTDSRFWWKLEERDLSQRDNPRANAFSIAMTKK